MSQFWYQGQAGSGVIKSGDDTGGYKFWSMGAVFNWLLQGGAGGASIYPFIIFY